ncbi:MAG: hypothetical protein ACTSUD_04275 [Alphaproteobacteria bacterium]
MAACLAAMFSLPASELAAEKDCSAIAVGTRVLVKPHSSGHGICFDSDRGNDPYEFGQTRYARQTLSYRDRKVALEDGTSGVEEYYCHPPLGIFKQVYRCPCGISEEIRTRAVCRVEKK